MKQLVTHTKTLAEGAGAKLKAFWSDESGMGTIEVILIIVVLIGLVMVFKKEIQGLVQEQRRLLPLFLGKSCR